MTEPLTFMGIPIVFDETLPPDTFYIVSNNLEAKRQMVLDRLLNGIRQSGVRNPPPNPGTSKSRNTKCIRILTLRTGAGDTSGAAGGNPAQGPHP
jgi:hypothetical protein